MNSEYTETTNISETQENINSIIENNSTSEITLEPVKKSKFDNSRKMEIKKKIEKIKKKEFLLDIFKIITSETKDYSENNNGVFIFFHDLSDETYEKVENYVNNIYKLHKQNNLNSSNIFNSELSESISDFKNLDIDKELTNKEKMIMRRKKYEEYLTHNQNQ
jgi:hypothetical protein